MRELKIFQQTTYIDTAVLIITEETYTELMGITNVDDRRKYLSDIASEVEWDTSDFVDGELPHYYEVDDKGYMAFDDDPMGINNGL